MLHAAEALNIIEFIVTVRVEIHEGNNLRCTAVYCFFKRYQVILYLSLLTVLSLTFCSCSMTSIVSDYLRTVVIVPQGLSEFGLPLVTLQSIDLNKKNLKVKSHSIKT